MPRGGRGPRAGGADVVLGAVADERTGAMPAIPDGAPGPDPYDGRPARPPGVADPRRTGTTAPPRRRRPRDDGDDVPARVPVAPDTGAAPAEDPPARRPRRDPAADTSHRPRATRTAPDDAPRARPRKRRPDSPPPAPEEGPEPGTGEPPEPPGPAVRRLRTVGVLVAVLVFATCAFGFSARATVDGGIRTVSALDPASDAISARTTQAGDENVLVLGLPSDRSRVPENARTDTAVLVHMPAGGAPAVTLGLPPTLEVNRPPCRRWNPDSGTYGETVPAESRTAFSAAYDIGGPQCTVGVVQQLTGMIVTRFVALDLAGTPNLVNAVRGVEVCTERPVVDRTLGPVVARAGNTVLAGVEAERFASATGVDDPSPVDRVQRQQRVLSGVLDQALSTSALITPGSADRAAQSLSAAVLADGVTADELLVLSRSLARADGEGAAPPYVGVPVNDQPNTRGHLELRRSESSELFSALREHEPLPAEAAAQARSNDSSTPPQGVVDVVNAAGRTNLAADVAATLRGYGYVIGAVRDTQPVPDTVVRFSPDRSDTAGPLGASIPGARQEPVPPGGPVLELVLGASFPGPQAIEPPAPVPGGNCG